MRLSAIYQKEWLKLRRMFAALLITSLFIGGYFVFDLVGQFANIEPESMMWYRLVHLQDKPYSWLSYGFIFIAIIVACCQYIPEVQGNRVRILAHLPWSLNKVVGQHVLAGCMAIVIANAIIIGFALGVMNHYYPIDLVWLTGQDLLYGQLAAIAAYLGLTAVIVENNWWRKAVKIAATSLTVILLFKPHFQWVDLLYSALILWLLLLVKDSFLSVKTRRIEWVGFTASLPVIIAALCVSNSWDFYQKYAVKHTKFYLFHSAMLDDFVYQRNAEHHQFFYGTTQHDLTKQEFEQALPFVYWKNLDIQGKLPITVGETTYNKQQIRTSRLSLQYDPTRLELLEVPLYPLFNPDSALGAIRFPEQVFVTHAERLTVYDAETAKVNNELTQELNLLANEKGMSFPIQHVWGKTTNMKPFDWGYFIYDAKGHLFNLKRGDDIVSLTRVDVASEVDELVYLQVSENRHKAFYGYAVAKDSQVYLISYPDYQFIPLALDEFDHRTMSFQLLSDPLNYLVRYDDGEQYHAVTFDKQYKKLASTQFE